MTRTKTKESSKKGRRFKKLKSPEQVRLDLVDKDLLIGVVYFSA